ncbi:hypothetical protein CCH79_00001116 [Gambusia affinis]|uniref:Uncharacterized protein n=1 Tax=Gambusia affinis TaxID=33528 RepID=A0A315VTG7_GAMAF|nr:hypothetical protein CCH79_00001116 [Gambusia affinis]
MGPADFLQITKTYAPIRGSEHRYNGNTWMSTADPDPELPRPREHHLELSTLVSLETDSNQEEGREETIVFL